jgi:hypothetical protein
MNHLIFYSATNSPGKNDAGGAFIPGAVALSRFLNGLYPDGKIVLRGITTRNVSHYERRLQVEDSLQSLNDSGVEFQGVWFLCHGYKNGMQYGYKWKWGATYLTGKILKHNPSLEMITFYSCLMAKDKDNFCEWTFDAMQKSKADDVQVFGHYTKGHTTENPAIKIYSSGYKPFILSMSAEIEGYNQLVEHRHKPTVRQMIRSAGVETRFGIAFWVRFAKELGLSGVWK